MNAAEASTSIPAISGVTDVEAIRVVIFINNQQVHVPLKSLLQPLYSEITALKARVTALESA